MGRGVRPARPHLSLTLVVVLAALLVSVATAGPAAAALREEPVTTAPLVGERVGIGAGSELLWEADADRQSDLDAIAASGARWTSVDVDWPSVQPDGPDTFDWSVTDRVVREATARNLHVIGVLAYAPRWAVDADCPSATTHCLPTRDEDFARFAKAAALRYGAHGYDPSLRGTVGTWQVWNEPNHVPFVQPKVDVGRYTDVLRYAYREIKRVDATSTVLAGATSPAPDDPHHRDVAPVTFLEGIYAHGGGDSFDAFAHHPYSFPCSPLVNEPWNAFMQTYWLHQALVRHGDGDRRIWGTEVGAPTGADVGTCAGGDGVSVTEAGQRDLMVDAVRAWTQTFGRFTGPLLWFRIRDTGTSGTADDHFGLLHADTSPKPAYAALTDFLGRPDPLGGYDPTPPPPPTRSTASAANPCVGAAAPAQWKHVVVVMFENTNLTDLRKRTDTPFANRLIDRCGHSPTWNDANYGVTGAKVGGYNSKPSYAVLTNGRPASATGIVDDTYATKTGVDNVYDQLRRAGRDAVSYVEGRASGDVCSGGGASSGSYHDPLRYYSGIPNAWCNAHDLDLAQFDPDHLPDLSFVIPSNSHNWHNDDFAGGDAWLRDHLTPLLDSSRYASGDTAVFFLTDEEAPAVNALIAPSVRPGSIVPTGGNPVSHYAGLRTFEEMLGLPVLADAVQAPSLVSFFGGARPGGAASAAPSPPPSSPPTAPPPVPEPAPGPPVEPVASACLQRPAGLVLAGAQDSRATPVIRARSVVDARTARWTDVDPWPVSVTGSGPVCWTGGTVVGTWPTDTPWETFHHTGGFSITNPDSVVEGVRVHDYGDAFNLREGAERFTIRGAHTTFIHDDCVQDDFLASGVVTDSLFDGCYVGISTRPSADDSTSDGRDDRIVLDGSLLRLEPMPTVFKGPAPGTGGFFKWDEDAHRSPVLVLHDDVLRADQIPNHGSLGLPAGYDVECSGVTIVWLGDGPFPASASWRERCPDTRIVTDVTVWNDAVRAWHAAHGR